MGSLDDRSCIPGALMASASLLGLQGFDSILASILYLPITSPQGGAASPPIWVLALTAIGIAEVVSAALLAARHRVGGPLGAVASASILVLAGHLYPAGELSGSWLLSSSIISLVTLALLACGWGCIAGGERPPHPESAAGPAGPPQGASAEGES